MSKITGEGKLLFTGVITYKGDLKFKIPYYQRPYSWSNDELEDFWSSIEEVETGEDLFFGSIITTNSETDKNVLDVVDGQQRIITFTILFLSLFNNAKEDDARSEYSKMIAKAGEFLKTDDEYFRLIPLKSDLKAFKNIQNLSIEDALLKNTKDINDNFLNAYKFFVDKTHYFTKERVAKLVKTIKDQIQVIQIEAPNEPVAIDTFQTINSMGMSLDDENIAKSILLVDVDEYLQEDWENIFRDKNFNNLDFFNHYLAIMYANDEVLKERDYKKSKVLRKFYNDLKEHSNKEEKAKEILKYAKIYKELESEASKGVFSGKDYFYCIKTFKELSTRVFLPVIMKAIYEKDDIKKVSSHLEHMIMSRALVGKNFSGFNKILPNLLKDPFYETTDYYYDLEKVRYYLTSGKDLKNKKARSILYLLEIKNTWKNSTSFNEKLSLEHIYPQEDKNYEIKLENRNLIYSIGNMMLLHKGLNSKNSNKPFIEKLKCYEDDQSGYLKTSKNIKNNKVWLDEQINNNANYILTLIEKTWPTI